MEVLRTCADETSIAWAFTQRDWTATVIPFFLFTIASSLEAHTPLTCLTLNASNSALLGFSLLYAFTISNQINGVEEDRLNKPDRPIVSGRVSIRGAYTRYTFFSLMAFVHAYCMNVQLGASTFIIFGALHNFTKVSSFGPTKDLVTTIILTSGLHSAWQIGGGDGRKGSDWIVCLALNLLFSISIQDLRDVVGDAATGRHTTPLLLGAPYDRIYISMCMFLTRILTLPTQYLQTDFGFMSKICATLVVLTDVFLVMRVFTFRNAKDDKETYRLYMIRFSVELFCACFVLPV